MKYIYTIIYKYHNRILLSTLHQVHTRKNSDNMVIKTMITSFKKSNRIIQIKCFYYHLICSNSSTVSFIKMEYLNKNSFSFLQAWIINKN